MCLHETMWLLYNVYTSKTQVPNSYYSFLSWEQGHESFLVHNRAIGLLPKLCTPIRLENE